METQNGTHPFPDEAIINRFSSITKYFASQTCGHTKKKFWNYDSV